MVKDFPAPPAQPAAPSREDAEEKHEKRRTTREASRFWPVYRRKSIAKTLKPIIQKQRLQWGPRDFILSLKRRRLFETRNYVREKGESSGDVEKRKMSEKERSAMAYRLRGILACPVCQKIMHDVVFLTRCMHRFCLKCITDRLVVELTLCPVCDSPISPNNGFIRDKDFNDIIDQLPYDKTVEIDTTAQAEPGLCMDASPEVAQEPTLGQQLLEAHRELVLQNIKEKRKAEAEAVVGDVTEDDIILDEYLHMAVGSLPSSSFENNIDTFQPSPMLNQLMSCVAKNGIIQLKNKQNRGVCPPGAIDNNFQLFHANGYRMGFPRHLLKRAMTGDMDDIDDELEAKMEAIEETEVDDEEEDEDEEEEDEEQDGAPGLAVEQKHETLKSLLTARKPTLTQQQRANADVEQSKRVRIRSPSVTPVMPQLSPISRPESEPPRPPTLFPQASTSIEMREESPQSESRSPPLPLRVPITARVLPPPPPLLPTDDQESHPVLASPPRPSIMSPMRTTPSVSQGGSSSCLQSPSSSSLQPVQIDCPEEYTPLVLNERIFPRRKPNAKLAAPISDAYVRLMGRAPPMNLPALSKSIIFPDLPSHLSNMTVQQWLRQPRRRTSRTARVAQIATRLMMEKDAPSEVASITLNEASKSLSKLPSIINKDVRAQLPNLVKTSLQQGIHDARSEELFGRRPMDLLSRASPLQPMSAGSSVSEHSNISPAPQLSVISPGVPPSQPSPDIVRASAAQSALQQALQAPSARPPSSLPFPSLSPSLPTSTSTQPPRLIPISETGAGPFTSKSQPSNIPPNHSIVTLRLEGQEGSDGQPVQVLVPRGMEAMVHNIKDFRQIQHIQGGPQFMHMQQHPMGLPFPMHPHQLNSQLLLQQRQQQMAFHAQHHPGFPQQPGGPQRLPPHMMMPSGMPLIRNQRGPPPSHPPMSIQQKMFQEAISQPAEAGKTLKQTMQDIAQKLKVRGQNLDRTPVLVRALQQPLQPGSAPHDNEIITLQDSSDDEMPTLESMEEPMDADEPMIKDPKKDVSAPESKPAAPLKSSQVIAVHNISEWLTPRVKMEEPSTTPESGETPDELSSRDYAMDDKDEDMQGLSKPYALGPASIRRSLSGESKMIDNIPSQAAYNLDIPKEYLPLIVWPDKDHRNSLLRRRPLTPYFLLLHESTTVGHIRELVLRTACQRQNVTDYADKIECLLHPVIRTAPAAEVVVLNMDSTVPKKMDQREKIRVKHTKFREKIETKMKKITEKTKKETEENVMRLRKKRITRRLAKETKKSFPRKAELRGKIEKLIRTMSIVSAKKKEELKVTLRDLYEEYCELHASSKEEEASDVPSANHGTGLARRSSGPLGKTTPRRRTTQTNESGDSDAYEGTSTGTLSDGYSSSEDSSSDEEEYGTDKDGESEEQASASDSEPQPRTLRKRKSVESDVSSPPSSPIPCMSRIRARRMLIKNKKESSSESDRNAQKDQAAKKKGKKKSKAKKEAKKVGDKRPTSPTAKSLTIENASNSTIVTFSITRQPIDDSVTLQMLRHTTHFDRQKPHRVMYTIFDKRDIPVHERLKVSIPAENNPEKIPILAPGTDMNSNMQRVKTMFGSRMRWTGPPDPVHFHPSGAPRNHLTYKRALLKRKVCERQVQRAREHKELLEKIHGYAVSKERAMDVFHDVPNVNLSFQVLDTVEEVLGTDEQEQWRRNLIDKLAIEGVEEVEATPLPSKQLDLSRAARVLRMPVGGNDIQAVDITLDEKKTEIIEEAIQALGAGKTSVTSSTRAKIEEPLAGSRLLRLPTPPPPDPTPLNTTTDHPVPSVQGTLTTPPSAPVTNFTVAASSDNGDRQPAQPVAHIYTNGVHGHAEDDKEEVPSTNGVNHNHTETGNHRSSTDGKEDPVQRPPAMVDPPKDSELENDEQDLQSEMEEFSASDAEEEQSLDDEEETEDEGEETVDDESYEPEEAAAETRKTTRYLNIKPPPIVRYAPIKKHDSPHYKEYVQNLQRYSDMARPPLSRPVEGVSSARGTSTTAAPLSFPRTLEKRKSIPAGKNIAVPAPKIRKTIEEASSSTQKNTLLAAMPNAGAKRAVVPSSKSLQNKIEPLRAPSMSTAKASVAMSSPPKNTASMKKIITPADAMTEKRSETSCISQMVPKAQPVVPSLIATSKTRDGSSSCAQPAVHSSGAKSSSPTKKLSSTHQKPSQPSNAYHQMPTLSPNRTIPDAQPSQPPKPKEKAALPHGNTGNNPASVKPGNASKPNPESDKSAPTSSPMPFPSRPTVTKSYGSVPAGSRAGPIQAPHRPSKTVSQPAPVSTKAQSVRQPTPSGSSAAAQAQMSPVKQHHSGLLSQATTFAHLPVHSNTTSFSSSHSRAGQMGDRVSSATNVSIRRGTATVSEPLMKIHDATPLTVRKSLGSTFTAIHTAIVPSSNPLAMLKSSPPKVASEVAVTKLLKDAPEVDRIPPDPCPTTAVRVLSPKRSQQPKASPVFANSSPLSSPPLLRPQCTPQTAQNTTHANPSLSSRSELSAPGKTQNLPKSGTVQSATPTRIPDPALEMKDKIQEQLRKMQSEAKKAVPTQKTVRQRSAALSPPPTLERMNDDEPSTSVSTVSSQSPKMFPRKERSVDSRFPTTSSTSRRASSGVPVPAPLVFSTPHTKRRSRASSVLSSATAPDGRPTPSQSPAQSHDPRTRSPSKKKARDCFSPTPNR